MAIRLKATKITGGFVLQLVEEGDRDLGETFFDAMSDPNAVVVDVGDGRQLPLMEAMIELIDGTISGFAILMKHPASQEYAAAVRAAAARN